jgi:hypothetical protein
MRTGFLAGDGCKVKDWVADFGDVGTSWASVKAVEDSVVVEAELAELSTRAKKRIVKRAGDCGRQIAEYCCSFPSRRIGPLN